MAIRKYISTCFLLGLVVMNNGESDISKNNAMEKCQSAFEPTVRFLHMMSTLALKTGQPFTIYTKEEVYTEIMAYLKEVCLDGLSTGDVCSHRDLLGIFKANILVRKEKVNEALCLTDATQRNECKKLNILLHLKSSETQEPSTEPSIEPPRITEFCENFITSLQGINHCQNCSASSPLSCDTVCTSTTTATTAATTTSYIEHSLRQEKTTEDGLQTSAVVIISVVSFIAGILCTIITVFFIRYFRNRQKEPGAKEEGATLDDVRKNTKVGASSEIKMQKMQSVEMTYERLTSNIGNDDKVIKEHVYHGLGTHLESNKQPEVTNKEENISKEDFRGNFLQTSSKTEDHVYNALEIKEHAGLDLFKNASAEAYNEHTYTGLANREDVGSVPLDEGTGNSGTNDRSNEGHYFILENTNDNETRALGGVEEQESNINEKTEDGLKDGDHDYFNLEKMDDSDLPTHKVKQTDEVRIDETKENTYHILEKV